MDWLTRTKIPLGKWVEYGVDMFNEWASGFLDAFSDGLKFLIEGLTDAMTAVPPVLLVLIFAAIGWYVRRSWPLAVGIVLGLLLIINLGYWDETLETLSLVVFATFICMVVGVPIGIAAAHRPWLESILRPVLDLMQTLPTFAYLIPTLILFGLGVVPGLISTVIFAIPAPIRLTTLGIKSTPKALIEAGEAFRLHQTPIVDQGRTALCGADDHGRTDPVYHAVAVDGGDCRAGRRRRTWRTGAARPQHRQHRQGF